jgi:hypothetical protein
MSLRIICSYMSMEHCAALVKHMKHASATCETCVWNVLETSATSPWNKCNIPLLVVFQCMYVRCSCLVMQVSADVTSFRDLTSLSIYSDPSKSFMKFGIKKSHKMISYMLAWIITETCFWNNETCFYIPCGLSCELVLMQHTSATNLCNMWNNLGKHW